MWYTIEGQPSAPTREGSFGSPLMEEVEHNVLKCVLGEIDLGSADSPDVEDVSAGHLECGRVGGRVKVLLRSGMSTDDP